MSKLLATDLDGTLFYPKKRFQMISSDSLRFIRDFIDDGGKFVIVSGRNSEYLERVCKKIDRQIDVIGCNASFVISNGKRILDKTFDTEKIKEILRKIQEEFSPKAFFVMSDDNRFVIREKFKSLIYRIVYKIWNFFEFAYREVSYVSKKEFDEIINKGKAKKIMVFFGIGKKNVANSKKANKIFREKYGDFIESSWSNEFIEITPKDCSKSKGLKFLIDYHKINDSDVYVVGDSGNDISMFNEFPENSFCMSHASLSVSKYARHVVKRFCDVEKFIEERK